MIAGVICLITGCAPKANDLANSSTKNSANTMRAMVSPSGMDSAEPAIAADAAGNIYVAYVEHVDNSSDLYLQKFDGELKPVTDRVRINPEPGVVKSWRGDQPTIKVAGDKVYVGWNWAVRKGDKAGNDLMLSVSSDGGKTFAAPVRVNDDSVPASHGMHGLEADGDKVYFIWLDERYMVKPASHAKSGAAAHDHEEPNAELYFAVSQDGGKTFSKNKKIAGDICPCCKVQTAVKDGRIFFSWRQVVNGTLRHIAVSSTADAGATFAEPAIVSDDQWKINACPVSGAPLAFDKNGALNVAWYTAGRAGREGIYRAQSTDIAKTFSPRSLLAGGMANGTPVLVYDEAGDMKLISNLSGIMVYAETGGRGDLSEIDRGDFPVATTAKNKLFVSYVAKDESGKRAVWIKLVNSE